VPWDHLSSVLSVSVLRALRALGTLVQCFVGVIFKSTSCIGLRTTSVLLVSVLRVLRASIGNLAIGLSVFVFKSTSCLI